LRKKKKKTVLTSRKSRKESAAEFKTNMEGRGIRAEVHTEGR